jgi:ubiquinone/menaquinone biosynthesis C-methylase UbiE
MRREGQGNFLMRKYFSKGPAVFASSCFVAVALMFVLGVHAAADAEIAKLAEAMGWKQGTVVADIGAGDGKYTFAAEEVVGASGKVFATEIDKEKLAKLRDDVKEKKLTNVEVVESAEAETNLPAACCDAIFLRRVYHHITKPLDFDASILRSLKPGGKLAIIDFPPHPEYGKVKGVPKDREDHGIQQKILVDEVTKAGFQVEKIVEDWPTSDYCVIFVKK